MDVGDPAEGGYVGEVEVGEAHFWCWFVAWLVGFFLGGGGGIGIGIGGWLGSVVCLHCSILR